MGVGHTLAKDKKDELNACDFMIENQPIFLKMYHFMFHFMSSLVTWDVVILVLLILKTHVWLSEILHFETNIL